MKQVQKIHRIMQHEAQRRDLFFYKENDCAFLHSEWQTLRSPYQA